MAQRSIDKQVNEVRIRGRVSGAPRRRELPSGDEVVSIRVVVPRPEGARGGGSSKAANVDTIECVAWTRRSQAVMDTLSGDEHVLVTGSLRRRFWRAGGSVASTVEVEVARLRRVTAPPIKPPVKGRQRRQASGA